MMNKSMSMPIQQQVVIMTGLFGASCGMLFLSMTLHARTKRLRKEIEIIQKERGGCLLFPAQQKDDNDTENEKTSRASSANRSTSTSTSTATPTPTWSLTQSENSGEKNDDNHNKRNSSKHGNDHNEDQKLLASQTIIQNSNSNFQRQRTINFNNNQHFTLREIGIITSPFPLRAGTPRQGLLAPHARSILTLHTFISKEALDDLELYSHVWVIFQFHLNPINKGKSHQKNNVQKNNKKSNKNINNNKYDCIDDDGTPNELYQFKASKIKPPRAKGKKVGVFATRSPHRPNNIGLSLAHVESVETIGYKSTKRTIVKLLGLDLVDGTPVYDIKPYIPSDCVINGFGNGQSSGNNIRTPTWVSNDSDKLASVTWTDEAKNVVLQEQQAGLLLPLYPPPSSSHNNEEEVLNAISEIIAQDPRAQYDGREQSGSFEITFCTLRVGFHVIQKNKYGNDNDNNIDNNNTNNACNESETGTCHAFIDHILKDPGDLTAKIGSYQHNLALRRKAEKEAQDMGKKELVWSNSVREGDVSGLFVLKGGGRWDVEKKTVLKYTNV